MPGVDSSCGLDRRRELAARLFDLLLEVLVGLGLDLFELCGARFPLLVELAAGPCAGLLLLLGELTEGRLMSAKLLAFEEFARPRL